MNAVKKLEHYWSKEAGEQVDVALISDCYYGFCSELGTLRLLKLYREIKQFSCGYSINKKTHFVVLEPMDGE